MSQIFSNSPLENNNGLLPLRVALLTSFIPPYRVKLFQSLSKRLKDFRIFTSVPMEPNRDWEAQSGGVHVIQQNNFTVRRTWQHPLGFRDDLFVQVPYDTIPQLFSYKPDVIIPDELGMRTLQTLLYRGLRPQAGVLAWIRASQHTEQGRGAIRHFLRRWLVPQFDAVFVYGSSGAKFVQSYGAHDDRVFCTLQATDVSSFVTDPSKFLLCSPRKLLYVGQLSERKGLLEFIRVLDRWARAHPECRLEFCLAGSGPLRPKIVGFPLAKNVQLNVLGSVPYEELPMIYREADFLVFPTLADLWGLVVNEAMASGLPVLGSLYSQAVEELVEDGVTGWTFYPNQPQSIYDALDRALSTPAEDFIQMKYGSQRRIGAVTIDVMLEELLSAISFAFERRQNR